MKDNHQEKVSLPSCTDEGTHGNMAQSHPYGQYDGNQVSEVLVNNFYNQLPINIQPLPSERELHFYAPYNVLDILQDYKEKDFCKVR